MKWSLVELKRYKSEALNFSESLDLKNELIQRDSEILDAKLIEVAGVLAVTDHEYIAHFKIEAPLTLPSARSLEPVEVLLEIEVDEVYMTPEQFEKRNGVIPDEEILILEKDLIDLDEAVVDNILLSIPLQVFTPEEIEADELPKGSAWEVLSEEAYQQRQTLAQNEPDPRLAKLADLFSNEDEEQ